MTQALSDSTAISILMYLILYRNPGKPEHSDLLLFLCFLHPPFPLHVIHVLSIVTYFWDNLGCSQQGHTSLNTSSENEGCLRGFVSLWKSWEEGFSFLKSVIGTQKIHENWWKMNLTHDHGHNACFCVQIFSAGAIVDYQSQCLV